MKYKINLMHIVLFVFLCGLSCLSSCTYDASFFNRLILIEESSCPEGLELCNGVCVSLSTKEHCGACNNVCTHDRKCVLDSELNSESEAEIFKCQCPEGMADCGDDLVCSWLDGGATGGRERDPHCGKCNVVCVDLEACNNFQCVCDYEGQILRNNDGVPLTGEALSQDYLRNDQHCGSCGHACEDEDEHCVLGQCTKTKCSDVEGSEECHFTLFDGREECQLCDQKCLPKGEVVPGQSHLIPVINNEAKNNLLNLSNTSSVAYQKGTETDFVFKRAEGCKCVGETGETGETEEKCDSAAADRCLGGRCICGQDSRVCSDDTTCTSQGCKAPCDALGRACTGTAECSEQQCLCLGAVEEDPATEIAHCIDGLVCAEGKCYCPITADSKKVECGVHGDRCVDGKCVCGDLDKACEGDAVCSGSKCVCGEVGVCDAVLSPNCVNGQCVCGTEEDAKACAANQKCADGQCVCAENSACTGYGNRNDPRGQADTCNSAGQCVCGNTGGPCIGKQVCDGGVCLCTDDKDCPGNEKCEKSLGQCSCGGAKSCREDATCTKEGYCGCSNDSHCNDSESCKNMGKELGKICVCANSKQKACKNGAECKWSGRGGGYKCTADDASACYEGERVKSFGFCVCGSSWDAYNSCEPGQSCQGGQCQ